MLKILIVDDSKAVHAFIKDCFSKTPHALTQAFNGEEALTKVSAGFDLVLLDWEMPKLNGPDTFAAMRKSGTQTPVIMMTTRNSMEDITKMIEAGVSEYMMKPFTRDILFEKIESVLGQPVVQNAA